MEIKEIKFSELKQYANNIKRHGKDQIAMIADSIQKYGFLVPIIVDENNVIVAGHGRYLAAKKIGLKTVPCIVAAGLTDEQLREYRVVDNRLADPEFAPYDLQMLKVELVEMDTPRLNDMFESYKIQEIQYTKITENYAHKNKEINTDDLMKGEKTVCCPKCKFEFSINK